MLFGFVALLVVIYLFRWFGLDGATYALLLGLFLWIVTFGVTVDGHHYSLAGCDSHRGLNIKVEP